MFYSQALTAVCFMPGTLYMGEKKPSNQWEKWGKNLVIYDFFFFFFKEQLMSMPIDYMFFAVLAATDFISQNVSKTINQKSSWVCFKKLAK